MHHYKPHKYKKKVRCLAQADNMENLLITFIFIVYVICIYLVLYCIPECKARLAMGKC